MSVSLGAVLQRSIDRLQTEAGGAVFGVLVAVSLLSTVAAHNQASGQEAQLEQMQAAFPGGQEPAWFDAYAEFIELTVQSQQVFEVGIPDTLAMGIGFLLSFVSLAVWIVGVRAVGENRMALDRSVLDGLGWQYLNAVLGVIGLGIAAFVLAIPLLIVTVILALIPIVGPLIALVLWLALPLLAGVLLFYWLPAIAVDDQNAIDAIKTSVGVARDNLGSTVGLVVLYGVLSIVNALLALGLVFASSVAAAVVPILTSAVVSLLAIGWMGTAYDLAQPREKVPERPGDAEYAPQEASDDEWGRSPDETERGQASSEGQATGEAQDDGGWSADGDDSGSIDGNDRDDGGWSADGDDSGSIDGDDRDDEEGSTDN